MICIAEDDLYFPAEDEWRDFRRQMPQRSSLCNGRAYTYKITQDTYGFHSTVLHKWSGFHLYVVHKSFYGDFLAADTEKYNIEQALKVQLQATNKQATICWPFAAVQAETPSDNIKGKIHKINDYFNKYNTYGFQ